MKNDLWNLVISEQEMYTTNGLGDVLDAQKEYRNSFTRGIDGALKFIAKLSAAGLALGAAVSMFFFWHYAKMTELGVILSLFALGGSAMLFASRWVDFQGRYILGKNGEGAYARYRNYLHPEPMQKRLFQEVERFNKLVRAINVSDEIAAAGVEGATLHDRAAVLRGMAIARTDLIRALKLERIMRENADVSNAEFQLFNVDLTHLAAMQVEDAATQQGKLMNEAFQIARSVQIEVRKLQTSDGR